MGHTRGPLRAKQKQGELPPERWLGVSLRRAWRARLVWLLRRVSQPVAWLWARPRLARRICLSLPPPLSPMPPSGGRSYSRRQRNRVDEPRASRAAAPSVQLVTRDECEAEAQPGECEEAPFVSMPEDCEVDSRVVACLDDAERGESATERESPSSQVEQK